jgi:hypothetical protein
MTNEDAEQLTKYLPALARELTDEIDKLLTVMRRFRPSFPTGLEIPIALPSQIPAEIEVVHWFKRYSTDALSLAANAVYSAQALVPDNRRTALEAATGVLRKAEHLDSEAQKCRMAMVQKLNEKLKAHGEELRVQFEASSSARTKISGDR